MQGHSPRTAHLPPTQHRQLGAQRSTTASRLAPHPLLHHQVRRRRNVHRHGGRALDQRATGPTGRDSPDSTTNTPTSTTSTTAGASGAHLCPPSQPAPRLRSPSPPTTNSGCSPPLPRRSPVRSRQSLPPPSCPFLEVFDFSFSPDWLPNLRQIFFPQIFPPSLVSDSPPKILQIFAHAFSVSAFCVVFALVSHWFPQIFLCRCRTVLLRASFAALRARSVPSLPRVSGCSGHEEPSRVCASAASATRHAHTNMVPHRPTSLRFHNLPVSPSAEFRPVG
jgi:hypothetical protein